MKRKLSISYMIRRFVFEALTCLLLCTVIFGGAGVSTHAEDGVYPSPKELHSNYFKSDAALGKYVDKELLAHRKTIVFYSDRGDLMWYGLPEYPTCRLERYSVMLTSVRHKFTATVEQQPYFYYKYTVRPVYKNSKKNDRKFYNKVRSIAKKAKKKKSVRGRAKYINNYLVQQVRYKKNTKSISTAYTAIMEGNAMCQGYADAFTVIARCAGLRTETVMGNATYSRKYKPAYHAWNVVKRGRKWYNIDVTFNDVSSNETRYFMLGSKKFSNDHKLDSYYRRTGWTKRHPFKK